jgi:hypothetical protein
MLDKGTGCSHDGQQQLTTRRIPKSITTSWDQLTDDAPLVALEASHALHRALAQWQIELVREAVVAGASWEDIGGALGTTKQGAWARFRVPLGDKGGMDVTDTGGRRDTHRRARELWEAGQARMREIEGKWREEQERLRQQVRESKDRLSEARRRHARERRDAQDELRREMEAARARMSA